MQKTVLILLVFFSFQSYSQTRNFTERPYLVTTASVDTLVTPDRIYLSITISEKDTRGRTSVEELETRLKNKLPSIGIDIKKQLTLSDVATNFKKYFLKGTDVLKNKEYELLVYDAETAGKVIVELERIDISNVQLRKTEYSKIEQLKLDLMQRAVIKAQTQAEYMLKPLNQKPGVAVYISDLDSNITNMLRGKASGISSNRFAISLSYDDEYSPIDIEFEKITVQSNVTVNFLIE
tara:strand:- start:827 stop:1534 length:708 start_codon:yes stop_codon:yes gene_type:complete